MTDWRGAFPDDSRVSWERRWAEAAGVDAWELAAEYRDAWRYDNRLPAARRLERHFLGETLPHVDGRAVEAVVAAVQSVLRGAIATGHASRHRPGAVLTAEPSVDQVAFAFDPSSDGEVVVIGVLAATVVSLVP